MPLMIPALILSLQNDAERRFMTDLFVRHHRLMLFTAQRYLPQRADAEDAVSDSLVALHRHCDTLRTLEEPALKAYIVRTVRNTALNLCSRQQLERTHAAPEAEETIRMTAVPVNVEQTAQLQDELTRVLHAIRALPLKQQTVLRMKLHQHRSDQEIAGVTGLSPESIRKTLSRARANLRLAVYGKEADTE